MADINVPKTGQGPSSLANELELQRDTVGFTHPNLHRRVDPQSSPEGSGEYEPRKYKLGIYGLDSYRTTETFHHNEDAEDIEIP